MLAAATTALVADSPVLVTTTVIFAEFVDSIALPKATAVGTAVRTAGPSLCAYSVIGLDVAVLPLFTVTVTTRVPDGWVLEIVAGVHVTPKRQQSPPFRARTGPPPVKLHSFVVVARAAVANSPATPLAAVGLAESRLKATALLVAKVKAEPPAGLQILSVAVLPAVP